LKSKRTQHLASTLSPFGDYTKKPTDKHSKNKSLMNYSLIVYKKATSNQQPVFHMENTPVYFPISVEQIPLRPVSM